MACTSGSVQKVVEQTEKAKIQIERLQKMISDQDEDLRQQFYRRIELHLSDARITDAIENGYGSNIKIEFASEFSIDKIASAVLAVLKATAATLASKSLPVPAISKEAIDAYTDVVNTVAEASKSSSSLTDSLSFSMVCLNPGLWAFLSASSVTITDKDTFGTEAITTTAIYHRIMESPKHLKDSMGDLLESSDMRTLFNLRTLQAALFDELGDGKVDLESWEKRDKILSMKIAEVEARLKAHRSIERIHQEKEVFEGAPGRIFEEEPRMKGRRFMKQKEDVVLGDMVGKVWGEYAHIDAPSQEVINQSIQSRNNTIAVEAAIAKLSGKGAAYGVAVQIARKRIANSYF